MVIEDKTMTKTETLKQLYITIKTAKAKIAPIN
jgi:hypothetical protein